MEYQKIQSVFKRDDKTNYKTFIDGEWSRPEFEYLANNTWEMTEKVDGTNIRVYFNVGSYGEINFKGRTDRADIPPFLLNALEDTFDSEQLEQKFGETQVVLYGEGYGSRIQKGGGNYRDDQSFVLFDVMINNVFLERENVVDIANSLGIEVVPIVQYGTLYDAIDLCQKGFESQWGNFQAEGVVCKPSTQLNNRFNSRIITKVKCSDFN